MHDASATTTDRRPTDPLGEAAAAYPPPGTHMPALDGLRGLAILMVLAFHFSLGHLAPERFLLAIPYTVAGIGWVGVDLFFVLSGFLITGILYDAKASQTYFRDFYAKRVLRIFPLYYGVLVAFFMVIPLVHPLRSVTELKPVQAWAWLYATNVKDSLAGDWCFDKVWVRLNQFWSLAVEEHFYMIWPVAVLLLG